MATKKVKSSEAPGVKNSTILGTFEGECADANITNNNGLDITREVWETVFDSDVYRQGIENGWYIGFLGHPEQVDCQDFRNACIVMRSGQINDNGKVTGKFDLLNTPVGLIVKTMIDAGVTFGISVRGAGDIVSNSVEPGTFDFRGFDLVAFPAFPEAIPVYTDIAASSDPAKAQNYKKICASVQSNLSTINSVGTLNELQSQFAKQSDIYNCIEDRKKEIIGDGDCVVESCLDECDDVDLNLERIQSLTKLVGEQLAEIKELREELAATQEQLRCSTIDCAKKISSMRRINANQLNMLTSENEGLRRKYDDAKASLDSTRRKYVKSSRALQQKLADSCTDNDSMKDELEEIRGQNLEYNRKIQSYSRKLKQKDETIRDLNRQLDETVRRADDLESQSTNRDDEVESMKSQLTASKKLLEEYQSAYAELYASAVGVDSSQVAVNANTSVNDLKSSIRGGLAIRPEVNTEMLDDLDVDAIGDDYGDLITL